MREEKCSKILIRGVNWIGDAVMTMPAIRALRRAFPEAQLSLLVKPWVAPLFEKDPDVDEIILYGSEYEGITGRLRLASKIREKKFCKAFLLQNAVDAAIIALFAGIKERIGYSRDGRRMLLTNPVPFDDQAKQLHHIDYYLNMLVKAGIPAEHSLPWIYLTLDERLGARERLKGLRRPVIALNPGATYGSSKRWRPERFAEVSEKVIDEMNGSIVIFGGPSETVIAEEIISASANFFSEENSFLNLAGKTSLRELSALISECDALVTNDSGPMHIGYAVGTPVIAVFGSTSPLHTGPAGAGNIVLKKELHCAPCFERECRKNDLACMDLVTSEEVFASVKKMAGRKPAVFFDRDGTLCRDAGYLSKMDDLSIFPEIESLKRLKHNDFVLIGVSNQSGIARGLIQEGFVNQVNRIFIDRYGFEDFYYCPHHPDDRCSCRKPEPGLLYNARADHGIDLKSSFVVGDKEADMLLAKSVGARGIHVQTGQERSSTSGDFSVNNLQEAVKIILEH